MCMGGGTPKPAPTPAAAPAPPREDPVAPVVNEKSANDQNNLSASRRGTSSLRINLASAAPSGGSGVNVPTG
jgi:hypothetical protein